MGLRRTFGGEREREREREYVCVCEWVRESAREREWGCVCVGGVEERQWGPLGMVLQNMSVVFSVAL